MLSLVAAIELQTAEATEMASDLYVSMIASDLAVPNVEGEEQVLLGLYEHWPL